MKKRRNQTNGGEKLGVDFGNTIVGAIAPDDPSKYPGKQEIPGSIRILRRLVEERFGIKAVYIISKVSPGGKEKVLGWMEKNGFFQRTGILRENVLFCAERREKGPISKEIGIGYFIDDRPEVLAHMPHIIQGFLFRAKEEECIRFGMHLNNVTRVSEWSEIERILL